MIIYRPHRNTLADAMTEVKEFNNEQEMKEYIVEQWNNYFSIDDIIVMNEAVYDNRNNWENARYVCTKRFGEQDNIALYGAPQCIGMCATKYHK